MWYNQVGLTAATVGLFLGLVFASPATASNSEGCATFVFLKEFDAGNPLYFLVGSGNDFECSIQVDTVDGGGRYLYLQPTGLPLSLSYSLVAEGTAPSGESKSLAWTGTVGGSPPLSQVAPGYKYWDLTTIAGSIGTWSVHVEYNGDPAPVGYVGLWVCQDDQPTCLGPNVGPPGGILWALDNEYYELTGNHLPGYEGGAE